MEGLHVALAALAGLAVGLAVGAWLMYAASYRQGCLDTTRLLQEELAQLRWQVEALTTRLQVASAQTLY